MSSYYNVRVYGQRILGDDRSNEQTNCCKCPIENWKKTIKSPQNLNEKYQKERELLEEIMEIEMKLYDLRTKFQNSFNNKTEIDLEVIYSAK